MKGGTADNTGSNEIRVAQTTQNSHWSKSMRSLIKSNLTRSGTNPFPSETVHVFSYLPYYLHYFLDGHMDFDGWEFCVMWQRVFELTAFPPFINSFPFETARSLE